MAAVNQEVQEGKDGTYYVPFPLLALASDGKNTFVCAGGGGSSCTKEKPNLVFAQVYDEATSKLNTIAALNTEKSLVYHISYSAALNLWLASAKGACKILKLDTEQNTLKQLCEFETETEGKEIDRIQNFAKVSPDGQIIVTGGTDGHLKLWTVDRDKIGEIEEVFEITKPIEHIRNIGRKYKELYDCDFSWDSKYLAICEAGGSCRIWENLKNWDTDGVQMKKMWADAAKGGIVIVKRCRFFTRDTGLTTLLVGADVIKGLCVVGEFWPEDGSLLRECSCGNPGPMKYLSVDQSAFRFAIGFADGSKMVMSENLKLIRRTKEVHTLPAESVAWLGDGTVVSGAGDNSVHFFDVRKCSDDDPTPQFWLIMCIFMIIFVVAFGLLMRVCIKGANLPKKPEIHGSEL